MKQNTDDAGERKRTRPEERFSPDVQVFEFNKAANELAREPGIATQHHRQKMLYRHGQTSLSLFLFEAGSELREHRADGTVLIQVLDGRVIVNAQGVRHEMKSGEVLVMSPGVLHDLHAEVASRVLLAVCLEPHVGEPKLHTR
jgi:quercetin dioxygenase-like cupin family protein